MILTSAARSSRVLLLTAAGLPVLVSGSALAPQVPVAAAATTPTPHLSVIWQTLHRECSTSTHAVHVGRRHHRVVKQRQVKSCRYRKTRVRGSALHLGWHQSARLVGHLTLAGAPIPSAQVSFRHEIKHHAAQTATLTTNAKGAFYARIHGPSGRLSVSYAPAGGTVITKTQRLSARAYLSLHIGQLRSGHRAHFSGQVAGGWTPQDLYVQFWYYAGRRSGFQPFAHLALVNRKTGHWSIHVPIPRDTAGYHYRVHATIVASPSWPWATTSSRDVVRVVR